MDIRFFRLSERQLLLDSIDRLWRHEHIYVRSPAVLEHLVLNTPYRIEYAGADNYSFVGMWDDDKVVGLAGMIPQKLNVFGNAHPSQTTTVWIVDKNHHRKLNGMKMLKSLSEVKPMMHLVIGISETHKWIAQSLGWYVFEDFPRWIAVVNKEDIIKHLLPNDDTESYLPMAHCADFHSDKYRVSNSFDGDSWDIFYREKFAPIFIGTARDAEFLKWRYESSPVLKYDFISITDADGNYHGLAVVRIESIAEGRYKIGRILEFIAVETEPAILLGNAVLNSDASVLMWDFYCLSEVTAFGLESVGFRRIPFWIDKVMMPTRFQPVDYEHMKIVGAIDLNANIREQLSTMPVPQWYITKGDADQDRAN